MIRVVTVITLAAVCAAWLGVNRPLLAAQGDAASRVTRQQAVASRLSEIAVGSVITIERRDGSKINGVLVAKTPDTVTVDVYQRRRFRRPQLLRTDVVPLDDIVEVKKPLTGGQIAAITAGIAAGVFVGACAIALSQTGADRAPAQTPPEGERGIPNLSIPTEPSIDLIPTEPSIDDPQMPATATLG